jgi:hypothetical protein
MGSSRYRNEPPGYVIVVGFLDPLNGYWILKKDAAI